MTNHDFLELSYDKIGFLVNRDQFSSSIYLENQGDITEYKGEKVFTVNLDKYLNIEFGFPASNVLRLALICDTTEYNENNRKTFKSLINNEDGVSSRYLAIKIGCQAEINSIPLNEIKLIPGRLNLFQFNQGLLGVRFKKEDYPQFLIDIERFVFNSLFRESLLD